MADAVRKEMRLRSPDEIKKRVTGDIQKLNQRLLRVSRKLEREAATHPAIRSVPGRILISFFRKAINTFDAIETLKRKRLIEESWVLLRVLLETHVNMVYFLSHDPRDMVHRYLDASVLDKLKHLREVNFYEGTPMESDFDKADWEKTEAEIKARYPHTDFASLRKHGFTGRSFEQRAKVVGMEAMYKYCYRIASRSVHVFDPAETPVSESAFRGKLHERRRLLKARRQQLESNQNMLLGRLTYYISEFIRSPLSLELILIGLGYEKFREKASSFLRIHKLENTERANTEEGEFCIWSF
jgi:hypothetical protein